MTLNQKGFTLIELLVAIAIIGILSSVVFASLITARSKAQIAKLGEDTHSITNQVSLAEIGGQLLLQITGNGCTSCGFTSGSKMTGQTSSLLTNISSWQKIGFPTAPIDPWGSPYTLDENEHEFSSSDCRFDYVFSAGPDGILGTSDDYAFALPHVLCNP